MSFADRALLVLALLAIVLAAAAWWGVAQAARRRRWPRRIDPRLLPSTADQRGEAIVLFSSPLCLPCREWEELLARSEAPWLKVDVRERPDLFRRYAIAVTPTVLRVDGRDGRVLAAVVGTGPDEQEAAALVGPVASPAARAANKVCSA